ncbi:MAG: hypothetical protein R3E76_08465 [Planctomycetota bacterium]
MQLYLGTLTRYYTSVKPLEDADEEIVAGAVSAWRHWLNKELPYALDWDESPTAPFETANVGERDVAALHLLAACDTSSLPKSVPDDVPELNGEHHPQVTRPRLWLPDAKDLLFHARELSEELTWVGSSDQLLRELDALQYRWKHNLRSHTEYAECLERVVVTLGRMARRSVRYRLPLRLFLD